MKTPVALAAALSIAPLSLALAIDAQQPLAAAVAPPGLTHVAGAHDGPLARPAAAPAPESPDVPAARTRFLNENPGAMLSVRGGRITRAYGVPMSTGSNAVDSATRFMNRHVRMLGARPEEMSSIGPFPDARHVQPAGWDRALGAFRYTIVGFTQQAAGIPVFQSSLKLLVRNEPGWPVTLAASDLRDLGDLPRLLAGQRPQLPPVTTYASVVLGPEAARVPTQDASLVIFAGSDSVPHEPTLAVRFVVERGEPGDAAYSKVLHVTDARDGTPLYQESLVCSLGEGIDCQVRGNATQGYVADPCAPEVTTPMPYARVEWSGPATGSAFGDATGAVTIPYTGADPLTVTARLGGRYFTVNDSGGTTVSTLSISLLPGAFQAFTHNLANATEALRAQVNAYLHANIARDLVLDYNPSFPVIVAQEGSSAFPINVNIAQTCNAFYNGTSINFYRAGGSCNNTAFGTVVHHEYGHHLVNVAGSGQGEYGEGFSDVVGVLVTDNPRLADGFSTCGTGIRRADNTCQFQATGCSSCGSAIHSCGQLISGCVWDTRLLIGQTKPTEALDIVRTLALDSVLLHTGTSITPDITVDFMMLDDDNAMIADGTPHYDEIQAGFSAHGMPGPPLSPIIVDLPSGVPQLTRPDGSSSATARVRSISSQVQPGTVKLRWRIAPATAFSESAMTDAGNELYQASLPAASCGSTVEWYVQAESVSGITVTSPPNAPAELHRSLSAYGRTVAFYDNFEGNLGWTAGAPGDTATSGTWVRVDPNGTSAQPEDDASNPGTVCWITGQGSPGAGVGSADVDGGTTTLVSPAINASGPGITYLRYSRWYSNNMGSNANTDSMPVEVSNDNGATWTQLEIVAENANAWVQRTFAINPIFPSPSAQFRVRLQARDLGGGSIVEAGLDEVEVFHLTCSPSLPGDVNGDGSVNGQDLSALLSAWGTGSADLNGDGQTNGIDLALLLSAWTG